MDRHPKIDNAPGLTWRKTSTGWEARWRPRQDLVKRGCPMMITAMWKGAGEPSAAQAIDIAQRCQALQDRMHAWAGGIDALPMAYDGTVTSLIRAYQTDKDSTYHKLRYQTRLNYDRLMRRLERDTGTDEIADLRARAILSLHKAWTESGVRIAHELVGMLRTLATFGATLMECDHCRALKVTLHDMRFPMGRQRSERLTADQANAIRATAHEMGRPSIALAQAFQFECMLRQKDVIGEWVPMTEPGVSDITAGGKKWILGLRWSEVDDRLILRHNTSKRGKDIEIDLKNAPMVMEEIAVIRAEHGGLPTTGAVILRADGLPWKAAEFRRQWRQVATKAGVPAAVYNMDSRAGAISEATDSGAELEHVRHAATHGDIAMTQRYSRGSSDKIIEVQKKRMEHRNKKRT